MHMSNLYLNLTHIFQYELLNTDIRKRIITAFLMQPLVDLMPPTPGRGRSEKRYMYMIY